MCLAFVADGANAYFIGDGVVGRSRPGEILGLGFEVVRSHIAGESDNSLFAVLGYADLAQVVIA